MTYGLTSSVKTVSIRIISRRSSASMPREYIRHTDDCLRQNPEPVFPLHHTSSHGTDAHQSPPCQWLSQETSESTESETEGLQEEEEEGISDGSEESVEQTTTIEVSIDSISMDTNLVSLGFVPVALFCIIFLLGIIALGGD